jgi:hypothetical protein
MIYKNSLAVSENGLVFSIKHSFMYGNNAQNPVIWQKKRGTAQLELPLFLQPFALNEIKNRQA